MSNQAKPAALVGPLQWPVGLGILQRRALELMHENKRRELYQTCEWRSCGLTNSSGTDFRPMPLDEALDLEARGLIVRKWPDFTASGWWVLPDRIKHSTALEVL